MERKGGDRGETLSQEACLYGPALLAVVRVDVNRLWGSAGHDRSVLVDGERGQALVLQRPERPAGMRPREVPDLHLARRRRRDHPVLRRGTEAEDSALVLGEGAHYGLVRGTPPVKDADDPVLAAHGENVAASRDLAHGHRGGAAVLGPQCEPVLARSLFHVVNLDVPVRTAC